ncbi:MAG: branched-chain amino acid ABC transporter ATP-binding protein/permease [Ancalomicrobiaceae bacterium]|nr:branched-chain amino acid ABC transporter ATP-binding protein/permease [Ancalomicrobiaceae bacterium]
MRRLVASPSAGIAAAIAVLGLLSGVLTPYQLTLANNIGLASLTVLGLVLLTGVAGMTSFGQAAFVGVGAYSAAVIATVPAADLPPGLSLLAGWPLGGLLLGLIATMIVAAILGAVTLRLSGHYLPLGTIAWGLSFYYLFGTTELFGGFGGISDIPALRLAGVTFADGRSLYWLIWGAVILAVVVTANLLDSRSGRAIRSLRGGQRMAESMGVDTFSAKMTAFLVAAIFAAIAGWLYAYTQRFVAAAPFGTQAGIDFLFMALIGGVNRVPGAIIGAGVVVVLREWLQDLLPHILGRTGNFETIVFGLAIVVILQKTPTGIAGALARVIPKQFFQSSAPRRATGELPRRYMPLPGEVVLEADSITRRFGGLVANNEVSLSLAAGEILALIGPNGAGKSTLFNQLSAVDRPTSGEIRFLGRQVRGLTARALAAAGLARTFQHVRLVRGMSVLENAAIGAHTRGRKGMLASMLRLDRVEEARLLAEAAHQLARVGLSDQLQTAAGSLPLGQQRLVEIARALASDPCVLLLDEPAAGLRFTEKQALARLLRQLKAEGMAILLVEHDMEFVMGLADRVVVIDFGETIAAGTPEEIRVNPAVIEAYLGGGE